MVIIIKLNEDVITPFGWHAELDEESRHTALEYASEVYRESHIMKILSFLDNTWRKHPTHYVYQPKVHTDREWFEVNMSFNSLYLRKKIQLREELKTECNEILKSSLLLKGLLSARNQYNF